MTTAGGGGRLEVRSADEIDETRDPRGSALERPGAPFWIVFAIGMGIRVWLAVATRGSDDANIWTEHAAGVARDGLLAHYRSDVDMNHPPFVAFVMAALFRLAGAIGVEFRDLYRLLFACMDGANVFLLARVARGRPWRWKLASLYAASPVALLLGAMHGNTDVLVATCLLLTCCVAATGSVVWTGVCIGIGAWLKLPALLAAPIFGFAFVRWRDRVLCAVVALVVAGSTYASLLVDDPTLLGQRVFAYQGKLISTLGDPPIWIWGFKSWFVRFFGARARDWPAGLVWYCRNGHLVVIPAMILLAYLRRESRSAVGLAATVAGCYAIFYGFVESFTFQYLAWSMPFWWLLGRRFGFAANLFAGAYLYGLYAHLTGDGWLRGEWDFLGHRGWPAGVIALRDLAHATFAIGGIVFAIRAWRSTDECRAAPSG